MKVARLKGLEPPAHCLEGSCSIQLSYRRNFTASAKARELLYPKKRFCQHKIYEAIANSLGLLITRYKKLAVEH